MNLTEDEKNKILALVRDPKWPAISHAVEVYCSEVAQNSPERDTEFETLKTLFKDQGKIQGVREFFQRLTEIAIKG